MPYETVQSKKHIDYEVMIDSKLKKTSLNAHVFYGKVFYVLYYYLQKNLFYTATLLEKKIFLVPVR